MAITAASKLMTDQDMGASFVTDPVLLTQSKIASLQAVWDATGAPVGTITIEASLNHGEPAGSNWSDISTLASPTIAAVSGAGSQLIGLANAGAAFLWVRLRYTRSSGGAGAKFNVWAHQKPGV